MTEPYVEKVEIEAAIGRCIARWYSIEECLAQMFRHLLGYRHYGPDCHLPAQIFYVPTNFQTQTAMVDAVLRHRTSEQAIINEWKRVRKNILKVKKYRDACAHCTIAKNNRKNTHTTMISLFSPKRYTPEAEMTLADLRSAEESIRQASIETTKFYLKLLGLAVPNPGYPEQAPPG